MGLFEFLGSFTHINTQYGGFAWYYGWEKEKRVFNLDDFGRENILLKDFEEAIGGSIGFGSSFPSPCSPSSPSPSSER